MPSGRRRPPVVEAAATTGSTGSTHGERNVARPATAATAINVTSTCDIYAAGAAPVRPYVAVWGFSAARARAALTAFDRVAMS